MKRTKKRLSFSWLLWLTCATFVLVNAGTLCARDHEPTGPFQVIVPAGVLKSGENQIMPKIGGAAGVRKNRNGNALKVKLARQRRILDELTFRFGIREGALKYVRRQQGDDRKEWLFGLAADVAERNNPLAARPADARRLKSRLTRWETEVRLRR